MPAAAARLVAPAALTRTLPCACAAQITHCSDKNTPEEIIRLVNSLDVQANGLIEYKSMVSMFVPK